MSGGGVGCRRRRDGQNCRLSGPGRPARPGAELQPLEEETQPQAEPKEAVEEAAEEARVAGGAREYQPPHAELREGGAGARGGRAAGLGGTCGDRPPIPGARRRSTGLQKGSGERGPEEAPRGVTWVPQTRPVDRPGRSSARHAVPDEVMGMHFGVRR